MRSRASFDRLDELPCLLCCSVKYELKEVLLAINEQKQLSMQHQWLPRLVQLAHASSKGVFHKLRLLIKLSQREIYGPIKVCISCTNLKFCGWLLARPYVSTTPLRQWGVQQCLPFSWTILRGKHCQHPIAIMGVVDMFGPCLVTLKKRQGLSHETSP